jgi:hypothetical protein
MQPVAMVIWDPTFILSACERLLETRPSLTLSLISLSLFLSASVLQRLKGVRQSSEDSKGSVINELRGSTHDA